MNAEAAAPDGANLNSPWRQPMVWLVLALPLAIVIAGVFLVHAAFGLGSTDVSTDAVQRTAQIQTTDLSADIGARDAGFSAALRLRDGRVEVRVHPDESLRGASLVLVMQHPVDTRADQLLLLRASGGHWQAPFAGPSTHDWKLQLRPADGAWRLHGRLIRGQHSARLRASLSPLTLTMARP